MVQTLVPVFDFSFHAVCQERHHHSEKEQTRIRTAVQRSGLVKANIEGKLEFYIRLKRFYSLHGVESFLRSY
jgi:hypothetical protein